MTNDALDFLEINRLNWNDRARVHFEDKNDWYGIQGFLNGEDRRTSIDIEGLGDLSDNMAGQGSVFGSTSWNDADPSLYGGLLTSFNSLDQLAMNAPEGSWDHLQCSACRMVTDQGVWVCPILVNEPGGRMGERIADTLGAFALDHQACWTCHVDGVSCRT